MTAVRKSYRDFLAPSSVFPLPDMTGAAQAMEARRAVTGTGTVHDSAVRNADAPNPMTQRDFQS